MNTLMSPKGWQNLSFSPDELRDDDDIWEMIVDEGERWSLISEFRK